MASRSRPPLRRATGRFPSSGGGEASRQSIARGGMHGRTLPGHTWRYLLNANLRAKQFDQSASPTEIDAIIARVPKSVNFYRRVMASLQSRHTAPVCQFKAQQVSGMARNGTAWRFSTPKARSRVVFVKEECDNLRRRASAMERWTASTARRRRQIQQPCKAAVFTSSVRLP